MPVEAAPVSQQGGCIRHAAKVYELALAWKWKGFSEYSLFLWQHLRKYGTCLLVTISTRHKINCRAQYHLCAPFISRQAAVWALDLQLRAMKMAGRVLLATLALVAAHQSCAGPLLSAQPRAELDQAT